MKVLPANTDTITPAVCKSEILTHWSLSPYKVTGSEIIHYLYRLFAVDGILTPQSADTKTMPTCCSSLSLYSLCVAGRDSAYTSLKVHKKENFVGYDFEFCSNWI